MTARKGPLLIDAVPKVAVRAAQRVLAAARWGCGCVPHRPHVKDCPVLNYAVGVVLGVMRPPAARRRR